ncbi:MAG: glycerol kinase GlpK [Rhodothalassiaceae bacterium]
MAQTLGLLAIDQGTTSSRAMIFDAHARMLASDQREFPQHYPAEGWVEHDAEDIWETTLAVTRRTLARAAEKGISIAAIGITNQRETTVIWDRATGRPIHRAIVWQDRRTADVCRTLKEAGHESDFQARTGLLLDPYFSVTKIAWILDHVDGARRAAENGDLAFGTVDSFLLWRLTGGRVHASDVTNAARTGLLNLRTLEWDEDLLRLFRIPSAILPEVRDCAADFGETDETVLGARIPIRGMAGDQQAASIGQCCFAPGTIKSTYGTGCFVLMNTGTEPPVSKNRLLATVAYRAKGETAYALEGSIFVAGAAVQWLRDGIRIIRTAEETEAMAEGLASNGGVYLVPAFTGLGAPHWDPDARGAIFGITRATGPEHLARAALESVCYQTRDLLDAMAQDGAQPAALRVDGGMVGNDWLMRFLAGILGLRVDRPVVRETTALGAACLAGLGSGVFSSFADFERNWGLDAHFEPKMDDTLRRELLAGWHDAVRRVRTAG